MQTTSKNPHMLLLVNSMYFTFRIIRRMDAVLVSIYNNGEHYVTFIITEWRGI